MNRRWCLMLMLVVSVSLNSHAQTFGEFFNQKKTQKRYLLEQIAALQVYLGYAKKGYELVGSGLQTVRDISNGEFGLHNAFISSLKRVSPFVRNHAKVAEVLVLQLAINRAFGSVSGLGSGAEGTMLSVGNQLYIQDVKDHVLDECLKDLEELLLVVTAGKVEMNDAQRLERLDKVYRSMSDKYAFVEDFTVQVKLLVSGKVREQESIHFLRKMYEKD